MFTDLYLLQFRQLQTLFGQAHVSIYHICAITLAAFMSGLEAWESNLGIPKKSLIGSLQMQLNVRQRKGIHFLQPWICFFIHGRRRPLHFSGRPILPDLLFQHDIINKPTTAEGFRQ